MAVYYNEIDPFAAAWLRELIKAGLIADGEVDERSIADVAADDVRGFTQCHWFAGIGGWSYALRLAGWPDDRSVWTGSCPCQPFSSAGAQTGGHDPRDLWPTWFQLVAECRPVVVFGEQVEAAIGHGWLDRVCDDLESQAYAVGACGLPAASVGAFHIRQRLWFVANADGRGLQERWPDRSRPVTQRQPDDVRSASAECCNAGNLADAESGGQRIDRSASRDTGHVDERDPTGDLGHANSAGCEARDRLTIGAKSRSAQSEDSGLWRAVDWIPCADGKARPVEPGTFPLAHGVSARVGRLRGYGNAIVPQVAQVFIEAYLDVAGNSEDR